MSALSPQLQARRDQALSWLSPLNLHILGAVVLLLLNVYLLLHLTLLWSKAGARGEDAVTASHAERLAAELAARPLRGLDDKLAVAQAEAKKFYESRLPYAYSNIAAELGALAHTDNVRLSRLQYVQRPSANDLTEVRMDASLTGDYRSLALFLNGLERDRSFFLIDAVSLSGQQSGLVNLRIQITTYLREPMPVAVSRENQGGAQ
jgi:Tfp pilus assembly protein PilO